MKFFSLQAQYILFSITTFVAVTGIFANIDGWNKYQW